MLYLQQGHKCFAVWLVYQVLCGFSFLLCVSVNAIKGCAYKWNALRSPNNAKPSLGPNTKQIIHLGTMYMARVLSIFVRGLLPDRFTHIFKDYFSGFGAIIRVSQRQGSNLIKQNKTTCMLLQWRHMSGMASLSKGNLIVCSTACSSPILIPKRI